MFQKGENYVMLIKMRNSPMCTYVESTQYSTFSHRELKLDGAIGHLAKPL